jgi:hypothetical protein
MVVHNALVGLCCVVLCGVAFPDCLAVLPVPVPVPVPADSSD